MGAAIGPGSSILMGAWLDSPGGLTMGRNSVVNERCRLDTRGIISIGNNVSISADVCIMTAEHDIQDKHFRGVTEPVTIEDYVFVGTRAVVLPGVTVGHGAVVAAGAVVTKNVEPYEIVAGVPARKIGTRTLDLQYNARYRRLFH